MIYTFEGQSNQLFLKKLIFLQKKLKIFKNTTIIDIVLYFLCCCLVLMLFNFFNPTLIKGEFTSWQQRKKPRRKQQKRR